MRVTHQRLPITLRALLALSIAALALVLAGGATSLPKALAAPPPVTSTEVTQSPSAGSSVTIGTTVTYTVVVTTNAAQAQAMTIQLAVGNIGGTGRTLNCTSTTNGNADSLGPGGSPSCRWLHPANAGTFTFVFTGKVAGSLFDAVPNAGSVVCRDTNNSNTCTDEQPADQVQLADSNGDVGPVTIQPLGGMSAEVNQTPAGGSTVAAGTAITYTATVSVGTTTGFPLTVQIRGDANIANRTLNCSGPGGAEVIVTAGDPACRWNSPLVGTYSFTFSGTIAGAIADAVPDEASTVCADSNSNTSCEDEEIQARIHMGDVNGDVGPVTVGSALPVTSEVNQNPAGGTIVGIGAHVTYTVTVALGAQQANGFTIQLFGDPDIANRAISCTSTTNGLPVATRTNGNPACRWSGPVAAGNFTMTFAGDVSGPVASAVPGASSVACIDSDTNTDCNDEPVANVVALEDSTGDVGPLGLIPAPDVVSEVNQDPHGGTTVAVGSHLNYRVIVTLQSAQQGSMTIQLRGDNNLINRVLICTSTNGAATTTASSANPSCMWKGPVAAGVYTLNLTGDVNGNIADAVPSISSVVCTDTNSSNSCEEEAPSSVIALADADGDVGPVTVTATFRRFAPVLASDGVY